MDSDHKELIYLNRAKNELDLAKAIFKISTETKFKVDLELKEDSTFFSNVISNAYYCIFYSAKAFLYTKGIFTSIPDEHQKTLEKFEMLAFSGEIDLELVRIYKEIVIKAEDLLGIFVREKSKRGRFTYKTLPQANISPAKESLENAEKFYKNINLLIKNKFNNH